MAFGRQSQAQKSQLARLNAAARKVELDPAHPPSAPIKEGDITISIVVRSGSKGHQVTYTFEDRVAPLARGLHVGRTKDNREMGNQRHPFLLDEKHKGHVLFVFDNEFSTPPYGVEFFESAR